MAPAMDVRGPGGKKQISYSNIAVGEPESELESCMRSRSTILTVLIRDLQEVGKAVSLDLNAPD